MENTCTIGYAEPDKEMQYFTLPIDKEKISQILKRIPSRFRRELITKLSIKQE